MSTERRTGPVPPAGTDAATTYEIRVGDHLDDHWCAWLGALDLTRHDDGTTSVTVSVVDRARLHAVLAGLRDIGAVLISLRAGPPAR